MTRPYREIGKPLAVCTVELIDALQLVADFLKRIRQGQMRYLYSFVGTTPIPHR